MRLTAWVTGRVQGVGFRWWVRSSALELGLAGFAENLDDGRVKVVAEGDEGGCRELLARLEDGVGAVPVAATSGRLVRPGRVSSGDPPVDAGSGRPASLYGAVTQGQAGPSYRPVTCMIVKLDRIPLTVGPCRC